MKYTTAQETYFDLKGVVSFYERLGKTATADYFRGIDGLDCQILCSGGIVWIPASFVRRWVDLASASPAHAKEVYQEIECHAIQWMPQPGDSQREIEQVYARVAAKNN